MGEREAGELGVGSDSGSGAGHLTRAVRCLRPSVSEAPWLPVPPRIRAVIERLHTQDNRITASPLFAVQQKRIVAGLDSEYTDNFVWVDDDGEVTDDEEVTRLDALREAGEDLPDGVRRVGYIEKWEFVTGCFTEQGCKDFIACNGHNLNEPRIYAYGSYRNAEFIAIREWLMSLRSIAPTGADTDRHGSNDLNSDSPLPHHESADTGPHGSNDMTADSDPDFSAAALRQRIGRDT